MAGADRRRVLRRGVTWSSGDRPAFIGGDRPLMRSGSVARANIFGFLIVGGNRRPSLRPQRGMQWQVGDRQGF
jgi:hypothetical protein